MTVLTHLASSVVTLPFLSFLFFLEVCFVPVLWDWALPANQHPAKRISSHMDHLGYCPGTSQAFISDKNYPAALIIRSLTWASQEYFLF